MAGEMIRLAPGRFRANLLRSLLTILGIVIGIAAVVALVSLGTAVRSGIDRQFAGLGADTVSVQPGHAAAGQADAAVPGLGIGGGGVGRASGNIPLGAHAFPDRYIMEPRSEPTPG